LALANAVILNTDMSWLRLGAGVAMLFVLPGLAWLPGRHWLGTRCGIERIVLLGGLSAAISSAALLAAVYWPEPFNLAQTLIFLDIAILVGFALRLRQRLTERRTVDSSAFPAHPAGAGWGWPTPTVLVILLAIMVVAIFLRWYAIGYGEFHEDEVENLRLAVRAMKGEEFAPFLDSKGPIHWLLPGALWLMNGWLNEEVGRTPFAICSTLTVLAVYALGRRIAGPGIGLAASGFVAINGFFVAYARHIENPSLIVLWGTLAAWCLYRFYQTQRSPTVEQAAGQSAGSFLALGGLFLGVGLVAHPDVILYAVPLAGMVAFVFWQNSPTRRRHWKALLAGCVLVMLISLAFYVPFVNDPYFKHTLEYFASDRVGVRLLYNQAADLFQQDLQYSTRYYVPLLILLSGIAVIGPFVKPGRWGIALALVLVLAIAMTVWLPAIWEWGPVNGAVLPYALLFLAVSLSPQATLEVKGLTLWFAIPFMALEFFARDAADHIQIVYPAWSLLAALGLRAYWGRLSGRAGTALKAATAATLGLIVGLILSYQHLEFLSSVADYWRAEADSKYNPQSIYRILYGRLPRPRKVFGNPRLGGWKVVGYLYDTGQLHGDFRSSKESFAVPIWYTYQTARSCFEDPQNYFMAVTARGTPEAMDQLPGRGYGLTRIVRVDQETRLYLFEKGTPAAAQPQVYDLDSYREQFDHSVTPQRFIEEPAPQHPLHITFGGKLLLRGYDVNTTRLAAGDTLAVTLHWQALAPMETRYRAFIHVETGRIWGQHDDDPICRLRSDEWRPPESGLGQFRVRLDPATPAGVYPVTVGIYDPASGDRLDAANQEDQSLGTSFTLTTITVE
jgi:4-amino-4-deoxy-L-arabinose transferase-like glycosyltransferase